MSAQLAKHKFIRYDNIYHCPADVLRLLPPEKLEEWLEEQREAENLLKVGGWWEGYLDLFTFSSSIFLVLRDAFYRLYHESCMLKLWLFRTLGIQWLSGDRSSGSFWCLDYTVPDFSGVAYDMHDNCGQWGFRQQGHVQSWNSGLRLCQEKSLIEEQCYHWWSNECPLFVVETLGLNHTQPNFLGVNASKLLVDFAEGQTVRWVVHSSLFDASCCWAALFNFKYLSMSIISLKVNGSRPHRGFHTGVSFMMTWQNVLNLDDLVDTIVSSIT